MKKVTLMKTKLIIAVLACIVVFQTACRKNLLEVTPTTELYATQFWLTDQDALYGLMGAYAMVRPCFDRDYYFDGQAEYTRTRGTSAVAGTLNPLTNYTNYRNGGPYQGGNYNPTGYAGSFDRYFTSVYGGVNNCNYVIENVSKMLESAKPTSVPTLEAIIGEAKLLRALCYFRLISMWGDVPYYTFAPKVNADVASLARVPIAKVKDSILADLNYAVTKLPAKTASAPALGRASKLSALALRGKVNLYWGSWNKNGWPELEGFTPNASEATAAFTAAAADFKTVINDPNANLYMNGDPGSIDPPGKADVLPNYYHLFTPKANGNPEMLFVIAHGGTGTSQGEELMRDFAGRSHEGSQCWVSPRYEIADRYQSTTTGDFLPAMLQLNPTNNAAARTTPNSALNPQTYVGRDYRMKSTIQWDYEMSVGMSALASTGFVPFIYQTWTGNVVINGVTYLPYNTDGCNSGYVFRKFVRNYAGQGRSDGDFAWPVIRLADVYLMYAEASNEVSGPLPDAIDVVNKIRRRGNLPNLAAAKTASKAVFFDAIEQERIIELVAEGHRSFDLRRWRAIERVWGPPGNPGVWRMDTWGAQISRYYQNTNEREYQQNYIFRIPPGERDRNPNLTQNIPWR
jgi:starch-binding outer membrane protein, SusD/RagB family